ncbi:MAG: NAD(P)/FAD-dependent oxidoreductase [Lapillicoccus sp.]
MTAAPTVHPALTHDVAVVGGGPAGLSAAIALARSRRSVVLVDAGEPRNAPAAGAHNVLGQEGVPPLELLRRGRAEAEAYGVERRHGRVEAVRRDDSGFALSLEDGATLRVRRLVLATGLVDELPDVPGVAELWGRSVLHCSYCHGWEVRDLRVGVLATSAMSVHQALLFRQLTDHLTLFLHTVDDLGDEAWEQLGALGVEVVTGVVDRLRSEAGELRAVVLQGGPEVAVDALVVAPRFVARGDLYQQLGGTLTDHPMGAFVETDPMGRTAVDGVWAAGNSRDLSAMVSASSADGVRAGAAVNADLVTADTAAAVEARRSGAVAV